MSMQEHQHRIGRKLDALEARKWRRMPIDFGPYWFTPKLEDRDLAEFVRVSCVEEAGGRTYFLRRDREEITPEQGWWLPILDERKTAPMTHELPEQEPE